MWTLELAEQLGVFPLRFKNDHIQPGRKSTIYSLFTQIWMTVVLVMSVADGLIHGSQFSEIFYVVTDKAVMFGSIPLDIFVMWKHRKRLSQTWRTSEAIFRHTRYNKRTNASITATIALMAVLIILGSTAPFFVFSWNKLDSTLYSGSLMYFWIIDCVFFLIYDHNTETLKCLNIVDKNKRIYLTANELLKLKKLYLDAMLNVQETNSLFATHGFLVLINSFAQIVSFYDFASMEIYFISVPHLFIVEIVFYHFLRLLVTVWISIQPSSAVRQTVRRLEEISQLGKSEEFLSEVETFSLQLTHIDLEFGEGFTRLNFGLVYSLIAAVVTNIVIIVQFRVKYQTLPNSNEAIKLCTVEVMPAPEIMGRFMEIWNSFLTVCGLSCVDRVNDSYGKIRFKVSRWKYSIPITLVCVLCLLACYLLAEIAKTTQETGEMKASEYLNVMGILIASGSIICAALSSDAYVGIKHGFTSFDETILINYSHQTTNIIKYTIIFLAFYVCSFIADFLIFKNDSSANAGLKILCAYIFQFYNLLSVMHFSVCLFWLRKTFALVNLDLKKQAKAIEAWSTKGSVNKLFRQNFILPDNNSFELLQIKTKMNEGSSAVEHLRSLRTLYHGAFELALEVNNLFGTRNVLTVGYNFVVGTIFMYSGISELVKRNSGNSDITVLELLILFKWPFISFLSICGLVWPCNSTYNEAQKTATIIQGLLTKSIHEDMRSELQSASFQFIYEQVSFSPHGFFPLNNNLLLSIMGAVVSYLVVLIQFRISMV